MPHIQHDLTGDDSPSSGAGCRLVITCSPRSPATRSVVSACAVGLSTVASVRSANRSSAESLILIHPPRATWVSAVAGSCPCLEREYRQGQRDGRPPGPGSSGPCRYQRGPTPLAVPAYAFKRVGSPSLVPMYSPCWPLITDRLTYDKHSAHIQLIVACRVDKITVPHHAQDVDSVLPGSSLVMSLIQLWYPPFQSRLCTG